MSEPSKGTRVPVGTIAAGAAVYAAAYLVWEQSHWGSEPVRNLVGNVAFMPFNLGVMTLFALASRQETLVPRVRRALRLLSLGGAAVFIGNFISAWYVWRSTPTLRSPGPIRST